MKGWWWFNSTRADSFIILSSTKVSIFDCKSKDKGSIPFSGYKSKLLFVDMMELVDMLNLGFNAFYSLRVQIPLSTNNKNRFLDINI